ncbi:MAG: hypothetical protein IIC62_03780, partial [Proteobacteria bacterium]|nr:hypothetical protein [Pseudomonadota bacterium]
DRFFSDFNYRVHPECESTGTRSPDEHWHAAAEWPVPDELQTQVNTLNDEQIEFITSGAVLKFIPERQLEHELATRAATRPACTLFTLTARE